MTNTLLYPMFAMALLVFIVGFSLLKVRIDGFRTRTYKFKDLATRKDAPTEGRHGQLSDNFMNLFEMPVLFYVLILSLYVTRQSSTFFVVAAWVFVATRYLHSYIHCTHNRVRSRGLVFIGSCILLFAMWITFAVSLTLNNPVLSP